MGAGGGGAFFAVLGAIEMGGGGGAAFVFLIDAVRVDVFGRFGVAATFLRFAGLRVVRRSFRVDLRLVVLRKRRLTRGLRGGVTRSRDCGARPPGINIEPPPTDGDMAPIRGLPRPPSFRTLRSMLTSDVLRS